MLLTGPEKVELPQLTNNQAQVVWVELYDTSLRLRDVYWCTLITVVHGISHK